MDVQLLEPPQSEPVTLEEAKHFLRLDHNFDDGLIEGLIKVARTRVECYTGQVLLEQTWRMKIHNQPPLISPLAQESYFDLKRIKLPRCPFIRLVGDPKIISGTNEKATKRYHLITGCSKAMLTIEGCLEGGRSLQVDFVCGYGDTVSSVPSLYRQAILILLADFYENRGEEACRTKENMGVSSVVEELLQPYRLLTVA